MGHAYEDDITTDRPVEKTQAEQQEALAAIDDIIRGVERGSVIAYFSKRKDAQ